MHRPQSLDSLREKQQICHIYFLTKNKKYIGKKDLSFMFVGPEKAFGRIEKKVLWWSMRKHGVMNGLYQGCCQLKFWSLFSMGIFKNMMDDYT